MNKWLNDYLTTWLPDHLNRWLDEEMITLIDDYMTKWLHDHMITWIPHCMTTSHTWPHDYMTIWLLDDMTTWQHDGMKAWWRHDDTNTWLTGHMIAWLKYELLVKCLNSKNIYTYTSIKKFNKFFVYGWNVKDKTVLRNRAIFTRFQFRFRLLIFLRMVPAPVPAPVPCIKIKNSFHSDFYWNCMETGWFQLGNYFILFSYSDYF